MSGPLFESFIITNFLKRFSALDINCSLYYWKSISGFEIDLIIESGRKLIPIEIKLSSTINKNHYSALSKWLELSESLAENGFLISNSCLVGKVDRNIYNCHWYNI